MPGCTPYKLQPRDARRRESHMYQAHAVAWRRSQAWGTDLPIPSQAGCYRNKVHVTSGLMFHSQNRVLIGCIWQGFPAHLGKSSQFMDA